MPGERFVSILRTPITTALCSAVVLGSVALAAPASAAPPVAVGLDGIFEGKLDSTGNIKEFLGIRYAQPVTGSRRWKAPQPVKPSFIPQNVTQFGNHCPQPVSPFGNQSATEDCLFLNVYAPKGFDIALPVMVWIHGGALVVGESNDYDASKLVERGVIVVTINYRLGALGFLAHPALSGESSNHVSGNYGIEDQQEALRWVRRNIIGFGGDPGRVTMFGESAGGLSTFTNLVSPTASGLFHRAIVESGAYMQTLPTLSQTEAAGTAFASAVGCTQAAAADVLTCLRALPVSTILNNQALTFPAGSLGPAPNVDGKILTQSIGTALGSGQFNHVPLINGSNHSEWNLFVAEDFDFLAGHPVTTAGYNAAIQATLGVNATAAAGIAVLYPVAAFPTPDQGIGSLGTDAIFACPAHFADELASPFVPTFAYEFNDPNAPQNFLPPVSFPTGASHASEIQYLFPQASPSGFGLDLPQTPLNPAQQALSAHMVGYWTQFAKTGDPNGFGPGQPQWPRFTRINQVMQSLVPTTPTTETNFAIAHQCAFWDTASGRTLPPAPNQSAANN